MVGVVRMAVGVGMEVARMEGEAPMAVGVDMEVVHMGAMVGVVEGEMIWTTFASTNQTSRTCPPLRRISTLSTQLSQLVATVTLRSIANAAISTSKATVCPSQCKRLKRPRFLVGLCGWIG